MMMDRLIVSPDTTLTLSSTCHWALNVKDTAYYYTWPSPLPFMDRATTRNEQWLSSHEGDCEQNDWHTPMENVTFPCGR